MSGIEIINTYEQVIEKEGTMVGFWIGLIISAALCILFITYETKQLLIRDKKIDYQFIFHSSLISIIISLFIGGLGLLVKTEPIKYETIYEVKVSEEVTLNEFLNNYEIIEEKEETLLVKEKF
jgi:Na+(H+)/acetate symporter ActP